MKDGNWICRKMYPFFIYLSIMKSRLYQLWYDIICAQYRYAFWRNMKALKALDRWNLKTAEMHSKKLAYEKTIVDLLVNDPKFKKAE